MDRIDPGILEGALTQTGRSLAELSGARPLLVVFLRHGGCPFCRETLADLAAKRRAIEESGAAIVLVHLMSDDQAAALFARYGLDDLPRVSDPAGAFYAAFELQRGSLADVMGPRVWWRGFKTALLSGHLFGKPAGDVLQLPGAFLLVDGRIVRAHRSRTSADRPDLEELAACPLPARVPPP